MKKFSLLTFFTLLMEIINKLVPIATIYYVQNKLTIEGLGYGLFIMSIIEIFVPFIVYGYSFSGMLKMHIENKGYVFSHILVLRFIHALIACLVFSIVIALNPSYHRYFVIMIPLLALLFMCALECLWVMMALQKTWIANIFMAISKLLSFLLVILFIDNDTKFWLLPLLILFANALFNLLTFIFTIKKLEFEAISWTKLKEHVHDATPFAMVLMLLTFFERIDVLFVEHALGLKGAALLAGFFKIAGSLTQISATLVTLYTSEMAALKNETKKVELLNFSLWVFILLFSPVLFGVWFVDTYIATWVLGDAFTEHAKILSIMTVGSIAMCFVTSLGSQILLMDQKTRQYIKALILSSLMMGILLSFSPVKIEAFGLISTLVKCLFLLQILWFCKGMLFKLDLKKLSFGFFPGIFMGLVLYMIKPDSFFYIVGTGMLTYALGLCVLIIKSQQ